MEFGEIPVAEATGAVLAHSLSLGKLRLKKGQRLTSEQCTGLAAAGMDMVVVARLGPSDVPEDDAALILARAFEAPGIRLTDPVAGRVNLIAERPGVFRASASQIAAFNAVDEAITIATLPDYARVHEGTLLATIKIIPYAARRTDIDAALAGLGPDPLRLCPFALATASLVLTQTPGFKTSLLTKGEEVVRTRLSALGVELTKTTTVVHETFAVAQALGEAGGDMVLILGASATSDRQDVAPAGLVTAGGRLTRFGMPVDPGNLLFLGEISGRPVVGLPGCARAPALNGTDWVLERLAAGLSVSDDDIARMGVGGLLKEIPSRPQPRRARKRTAGGPHVLLLAAGKSSRMGGTNKLLRDIDGTPLALRSHNRLQEAGFPVHVVADPANTSLMTLLNEAGARIVPAPDAGRGLSASLRAGVLALPEDASAVIIALADMPEITAAHLHALAAAHAPEQGAGIVVPVAPNGKRGNPVLFDRRYFDALTTLSGDTGGRSLIDAAEGVATVPADTAVLLDLDTPQAWEAWETGRFSG